MISRKLLLAYNIGILVEQERVLFLKDSEFPLEVELKLVALERQLFLVLASEDGKHRLT
jgi:hypothetical protein